MRVKRTHQADVRWHNLETTELSTGVSEIPLSIDALLRGPVAQYRTGATPERERRTVGEAGKGSVKPTASESSTARARMRRTATDGG